MILLRSFMKTTEQYSMNARPWILWTPWVQEIKKEAQRRDATETWRIGCMKTLELWTHTPTPPPSLLLLGCREVSNFVVPCAPCHDASSLAGPGAMEWVNHGMKPLKPWPKINLSSSSLSQVFCHSVTVIKLTNIFIFWSTAHTACHILKYCMPHSEVVYVLCMSQPKVLYILYVTFWNTLCVICHIGG